MRKIESRRIVSSYVNISALNEIEIFQKSEKRYMAIKCKACNFDFEKSTDLLGKTLLRRII